MQTIVKKFTILVSCLLLKLTGASVLPDAQRFKVAWRDTDSERSCTNGPLTRGCWDSTSGTNYSIATDAETSWPKTGIVVPYTLVITAGTLAPDGYSKSLLLINGSFPGPTLTANWGDTLEIIVKNEMIDNGTSIHWHGISQINSNTQDGVNGVTECPIPPKASRIYRFIANEFGTTWYHSHYSAQYGDGIVGSIVINGPATSNYDHDLGVMPITDWYYKSMYEEGLTASTNKPPQADNGLINGTMMNVAKTTGKYNIASMKPGKKYRLRLINTSVDNHFYVSLDNHDFLVIQADFVPIQPYTTKWLFLAIGQRYDVIITASQKPDNYWFRAKTKNCGDNANEGNILAIFNYDNCAISNPRSTASSEPSFSCTDEAYLIPYNPKAVDESAFVFVTRDTLNVSAPTKVNGVFEWTIGGATIDVDWDKPTLSYIAEGNTSYPKQLAVLELPDADVWSFWVIQNLAPIAHPIHIHGHDFSVLGAAANATFTSSTQSALNFANPTRRDVAMLPSLGYLVIAFKTDNPGAWLMHCHIAWHVGEGLAVQFLERADDIPSTLNLEPLKDTCKTWDEWYAGTPFKKLDSGL